MEKHKQDSEVKMTIRFEENVSTENAQFVCQWSKLTWQILSRTMDGTNDSFSLDNSSLARFGRNLFNI